MKAAGEFLDGRLAKESSHPAKDVVLPSGGP